MFFVMSIFVNKKNNLCLSSFFVSRLPHSLPKIILAAIPPATPPAPGIEDTAALIPRPTHLPILLFLNQLTPCLTP